MKKIIISVPTEVSDAIQACQVEMDGLKQLIGYAMSTTDYVIPKERIDELQNQFMVKNKEYNQLKEEVEKLIPADFDKTKTNWNLDFATYKAEVIEI